MAKYAKQMAERYSSRFKTNDDAPSAVTVLRKTLAAARNDSVRLATFGYLTNVAGLLRPPETKRNFRAGRAFR